MSTSPTERTSWPAAKRSHKIISAFSDLTKFLQRSSQRRVRHGKAARGEDLANAGDTRADISPRELPLDDPAHGRLSAARTRNSRG